MMDLRIKKKLINANQKGKSFRAKPKQGPASYVIKKLG